MNRTTSIALLVGLLVSLVVHATVLVPGLVGAMRGRAQARLMPARFAPDDFRRPDTPPVAGPGVDAVTPSTVTWIGYAEYEEHLAELAELEQAAFRATPPAPSGAPAPAVQPTAEAAAPDLAAGTAPGLRPEDLLAFRAFLEGLNPLAEGERGAWLSSFADRVARQREIVTAQARAAEVARERPDTPPEAEPAPEVSPPAPDAPPVEQPDRSDDPGAMAEKESPATSIEMSADEIRLGKPLAREGFELEPRRPQFQLLTMLTSSPSNPLVVIRFARDGTVRDAEILETSGDSRIDHGIWTSLFRWRASGPTLEELGDEQTFDVEVRMTLR